MTLTLLKSPQPPLLDTPWFEVQSGGSTFPVHRTLLAEQLDRDVVLQMARHAVKQVVVETSAYCNRSCVFCPNKDGIRTQKKYMDRALFQAILADLQAIDFGGSMLFHLYNEPLADDHIFDYIAAASQALPQARLALNSNGDYLDAQMFDRLAAAGLRQLSVSVYGKNPGHFDAAYILARINALVAKLGLQLRPNSKPMDVLGRRGGLSVRIFAEDFNTNGYDRGGLLDVGLQQTRQSPCASPFKELLVSYDGSVIPCCNIHPDSAAHTAYIIGKVTPTRGLLEIFASEQHAAWRRDLLLHKPQGGPCATCTRQACSGHSAEAVERYNTDCGELLHAAAQAPAAVGLSP